jgi:hypothetical protein
MRKHRSSRSAGKAANPSPRLSLSLCSSSVPAFATADPDTISGAMYLDLSDEEAAALTQELHETVKRDRFPFSPRIQTLRAILAKLRPEPARPVASPEPKVYEPPSRGRYRRRQG